MYFSAYTVEKVSVICDKLKTKVEGLSFEEAKKRIQQYGFNQISGKEIKWFHILGRQFKSPFIYLLFFAAGLSLVLGEKVDGIMIIGFILINTVLGFSQEYHSEKSLQMLKKFVLWKARVKRENKNELIDSKQLVPGDIVMIETGDMISADIRLIDINDLSIDESILTGESEPVNKVNTELDHEALSVHEAHNICFSGTKVVSGQGTGVVIATGRNAVIGEVAKLTTETTRESIFEKGIARFSNFILRMILVILILLFVVNIALKGADQNHLLELVLFSIALAVSVIPEALPVVTTLSLSRGALQLAKNKVVVKRLSAVEDLGSIEVLCTDKTGTLTENKLTVANINSPNQTECLYYAALASSFLTEKKGEREPNNSFDIALWDRVEKKNKEKILKIKRLSEIPFDPERKRNSVLVKNNEATILIVRGAPESVIGCSHDLSAQKKQEYLSWLKIEGREGRRCIAIAVKQDHIQHDYDIKDENNLNLIGLISFIDPIKDSAKDAILQAEKLGIEVKILTGDSKEVSGAVAHQVGLADNPEKVLLGEDLEKMNNEDQMKAVKSFSVFARVSPQQKYRIIELLQRNKEVGFLGEGINDAPALKLANVALVVDGAADIAREAADIVLLKKSLAVIIEGIENGRKVFANTVKYLKITLISNFGNFYAIAIASLIIPFLPMLPVQILLLNLLSDFPMIAIALDSVDPAELKRPRTYNIKEVVLIAIILGLVSTVFDSIFFMLFFREDPSILQTNWFIGSVLTELVLIFSVRTHFFFLRAKAPSKVLSLLFVFIVGVTIIMPYTGLGESLFKFHPPTLNHLLIIFGVVLSYFVVTETIKIFYYRFTGNYQK
ncbi:MAG: magnesium-translocating P-type ATPase [Patescibacteria group bacterium]|jgi:Mg2+-importing ATPase